MTNMLAAGLLALALAAPTIPARIIARLGAQTITYDAIRCHHEEFAGRPLPQGVDLDTFCHQLEQQKLDRLLLEDLLDVAARQYQLEPVQADVSRALSHNIDPAAAARRFDTMAQALLDKMQGASDAAIRRKWLDPNGISVRDLESFALAFRTADEVQRYLAQDNAKLMRESLEQQKRREIIIDRLRSRVAAETKRSGRKEDAVAADTWADLVRRAGGLEVLDSAFRAPSMKGVLIP